MPLVRVRSLLAVALSFLSILLVPSVAHADPHAEALVAKARALHLADALAWLRLGHYRTGFFANAVSEVDGREFFLSPAGKEDPEAELEATIRALAAPVDPAHEDAHAACRFPARRAFLATALGPLPAPKCEALVRFRASIDPASVSLVFASEYVDNPASAFGHTFLRLRKKTHPGDAMDPIAADLRDMAIDFTPTITTTNPLFHTFGGIGGAFPGRFRFHSFEEKAREYGNHDERDLWSYDLDLGPSELEMLALHLFELSQTHIDYFYMTENCTYHVVALLEAAAPRIDVLSKNKPNILPADLVRAFDDGGFVVRVHYLPSTRSRLREANRTLTARERALVKALARDPRANLADVPPRSQAHAIDAAILILEMQRPSASPERAEDLFESRKALETRRSALAEPPAPLPEVPPEEAPALGHGSMRGFVGGGFATQHSSNYGEMGYRLALHDLVDPSEGEEELNELVFLDTRLRYDANQRVITLNRLTIADVLSLRPITAFERGISWRARAFGVRLHDRGCSDCFAHGVNVSAGATFATRDEKLAVFAMADAYVAIAGHLDGIDHSLFRVGVGPFGGVRAHLPFRTIALVTGTASYLPGAHLRGTYVIEGALRTGIGRDFALGVELMKQPLSLEGELAGYVYF